MRKEMIAIPTPPTNSGAFIPPDSKAKKLTHRMVNRLTWEKMLTEYREGRMNEPLGHLLAWTVLGATVPFKKELCEYLDQF